MDPIFFYRNLAPAPSGASAGPRVAVQPNLSVRDWPTTAGSNALAGYVALEDATVVQRLHTAGAYLCGSTHMSEFGFGLLGSQAGAALRDRAADVELVLDLLGESRLAAARAGVFGFKPSYGSVSRLGLVGLIPSLECCGMLSESLKDIREVFRAVSGPDGFDLTLSEGEAFDLSPSPIDPKATRIGFVTEACSSLLPEEAESFGAALDGLRQAGFALRESSLPDFPLFSPVHRIIGSVEASSCTGRYDSVRYGPRAPGAKNWNEMYLLSRGAAFGTPLKSYLLQGAFFQFERYAAFEDACRVRRRLVEEMQRLMAEVDFLVFPPAGAMAAGGAVSDTPPTVVGLYELHASTLFANVTGQPALHLPPEPGEAGNGIQLVGRRSDDARLLALGELVITSRRGGR